MATTSAERQRKVQKRLDKIAQKHGYKTWTRLSTAVLHGKIKLIPIEDNKPNLFNNT